MYFYKLATIVDEQYKKFENAGNVLKGLYYDKAIEEAMLEYVRMNEKLKMLKSKKMEQLMGVGQEINIGNIVNKIKQRIG